MSWRKRGDGFGCDPVIVLFVLLSAAFIYGLVRTAQVVL